MADRVRCEDCWVHKAGTQDYRLCRGTVPATVEHECPAFGAKQRDGERGAQ